MLHRQSTRPRAKLAHECREVRHLNDAVAALHQASVHRLELIRMGMQHAHDRLRLEAKLTEAIERE